MEAVTQKVKFLRNLRIPFVVAALLSFGVEIAYDVLIVYAYAPWVFPVWAFTFVVLYLALCVGYLVYGRKLAGLMPRELSKHVHRVSVRGTYLNNSKFMYDFA